MPHFPARRPSFAPVDGSRTTTTLARWLAACCALLLATSVAADQGRIDRNKAKAEKDQAKWTERLKDACGFPIAIEVDWASFQKAPDARQHAEELYYLGGAIGRFGNPMGDNVCGSADAKAFVKGKLDKVRFRYTADRNKSGPTYDERKKLLTVDQQYASSSYGDWLSYLRKEFLGGVISTIVEIERVKAKEAPRWVTTWKELCDSAPEIVVDWASFTIPDKNPADELGPNVILHLRDRVGGVVCSNEAGKKLAAERIRRLEVSYAEKESLTYNESTATFVVKTKSAANGIFDEKALDGYFRNEWRQGDATRTRIRDQVEAKRIPRAKELLEKTCGTAIDVEVDWASFEKAEPRVADNIYDNVLIKLKDALGRSHCSSAKGKKKIAKKLERVVVVYTPKPKKPFVYKKKKKALEMTVDPKDPLPERSLTKLLKKKIR